MESQVLRSKVGRYEIVERLGGGGWISLFRGFDPLLRRTVVVKTWNTNEEELRSGFLETAERVANLHHRNLAAVVDFGIDEGCPYLVEEHLPGEDLRAKLKRRDFLPFPEKVHDLLQTARALAHAHGAGIVHADLRPTRLRILPDGSLKLRGFGALRPEGRASTHSSTGLHLGGAAYLAPEQIRGARPEPAVDVFAFGVLGYELIASRRPFEGGGLAATLDLVLHSEPPPLADFWPAVPREIASLIERCLEKDPSRRHPQAAPVAAALEEWQKLGPTSGKQQRPQLEPRTTTGTDAAPAPLPDLELA